MQTQAQKHKLSEENSKVGPKQKKLNEHSSGGFSTIGSKSDFMAHFPDVVFHQETFATEYTCARSFSRSESKEVFSLIMPELLATYSVLHRESEKTMYFPVFAVISKILLVLRDTLKAPHVSASDGVMVDPTSNTEQSEVDDDATTTATLPTERSTAEQLRHEQQLKSHATTGPVEFVIQNLDRIGFIVEVKRVLGSLEWHKNADFWQLVGELYAACRMNAGKKCPTKGEEDNRYVYGALTSFTVWVFLRARISSGIFSVQVSDKLTAFTEQQFTLDPEIGATKLLSFLVDALYNGFDNAKELLPENLAEHMKVARAEVQTCVEKFLQSEVFN